MNLLTELETRRVRDEIANSRPFDPDAITQRILVDLPHCTYAHPADVLKAMAHEARGPRAEELLVQHRRLTRGAWKGGAR